MIGRLRCTCERKQRCYPPFENREGWGTHILVATEGCATRRMTWRIKMETRPKEILRFFSVRGGHNRRWRYFSLIGGSVIVIGIDRIVPDRVAVIITWPALKAVTNPDVDTIATDSLDEDHFAKSVISIPPPS